MLASTALWLLDKPALILPNQQADAKSNAPINDFTRADGLPGGFGHPYLPLSAL